MRFEGEIDRRIRALFTNNLALLNWDADFIEPCRRRDWPEGADACRKHTGLYVGIGKCLDALVRAAEYTGDPRVSALKQSIIDKLLGRVTVMDHR